MYEDTLTKEWPGYGHTWTVPRSIVTVVYRDSLTEVTWVYSHPGTVSGSCSYLVYGDTLKNGYGHPRTVPGRSTVTVVYEDTLTNGYITVSLSRDGHPGTSHPGPSQDCPRMAILGQSWEGPQLLWFTGIL